MAKYSISSAAERVGAMSDAFDRASHAVQALRGSLDAFEEIKGTVAELDEYQSSGLWLKDYEADEAGKLPADVSRSVLSQDGLYDLLSEYDALRRRLATGSADSEQ